MSVYQVPKSKASIAQNRFEFKMPDGKKRSVPLLEFIKPDLALKIAELEITIDAEGNRTTDPQETAKFVSLVFETYFPGENLFSQFEDSEQFANWMGAWTEQSGVTPGESSASPKS